MFKINISKGHIFGTSSTHKLQTEHENRYYIYFLVRKKAAIVWWSIKLSFSAALIQRFLTLIIIIFTFHAMLFFVK